MSTTSSLKPALSSFVAASFAVLAATGALLFFDVEARPIEALHQWFGWMFVLAGVVHVVLNVRQLAAYLRLGAARWSLASVLLLAAGLLVLGWTYRGEEHHADPAPPAGPARASGRDGAEVAGAPALPVLPASLPALGPLSCPM